MTFNKLLIDFLNFLVMLVWQIINMLNQMPYAYWYAWYLFNKLVYSYWLYDGNLQFANLFKHDLVTYFFLAFQYTLGFSNWFACPFIIRSNYMR
jgi:hypothetical protein